MFRVSLDSDQAWLAILGFILVPFMGRQAWVDYKIPKSRGVRSSVLATIPITGKVTCFENSIFTTDGQLWSESRALIRPMFIKDRVRDLEIFDKWTKTLIDKLPASGQTVDIMDLFYRMTLDVTTDFLLGHSVDSLNNPKHQFVDAFQQVQRIQMMLTTLGPHAPRLTKT
ncbi:hypothetical protein QBC45DRAFT_396071 [Copromyces sp. CBS 386.78]|nr:hypothetical protein QBC45DRAFT_396071 [Copromyces sp. CBS 386.78]